MAKFEEMEELETRRFLLRLYQRPEEFMELIRE